MINQQATLAAVGIRAGTGAQAVSAAHAEARCPLLQPRRRTLVLAVQGDPPVRPPAEVASDAPGHCRTLQTISAASLGKLEARGGADLARAAAVDREQALAARHDAFPLEVERRDVVRRCGCWR